MVGIQALRSHSGPELLAPTSPASGENIDRTFTRLLSGGSFCIAAWLANRHLSVGTPKQIMLHDPQTYPAPDTRLSLYHRHSHPNLRTTQPTAVSTQLHVTPYHHGSRRSGSRTHQSREPRGCRALEHLRLCRGGQERCGWTQCGCMRNLLPLRRNTRLHAAHAPRAGSPTKVADLVEGKKAVLVVNGAWSVLDGGTRGAA